MSTNAQTIRSDFWPRETWLEKCRSLRFFNSVILQTAFDDKFNDMGQLQLLLCDFLDPKQTPEQKKLISVFRGSYKTAQILGYALYEFCWAVQEERSTSIVYNTATKENAEGMNDDFRHTLRTCQLLRWIFDKLPEDPDNAFAKFTKIKVEYKNVKFHVASLDTRQVSRHYHCILPGVNVYSSNGLIPIEKIEVGNRVLGRNGIHNEVVAVKKSLHRGRIVKLCLCGQPEPIKSTAEHRFLVWDGDALSWREAGYIKKGDLLATPLPSGLTRAYSKINDRINKIIEKPSFWRFVGYWLAEGCASEGNRIRLTFGKHEHGYVEEVKQIIKSCCGKDIHVSKTKSSTIMVDFSDADVKEILSKFGSHSYDKHLPAFVLSANPKRQRELILGYFRGDGHNRDTAWHVTSVSPSLIDGMQIILANNGIPSAVCAGSKAKLMPIMGNLCKIRDSFNIFVNHPLMSSVMGTKARFPEKPFRMKFIPGYMLKTVASVSSEFYDGPVYDIQVRKSESFTVQGACAHNCVINDDLVNDDNAYSDIERENVKRKWKFQKSILTRYKKFGVGMEIDVGTVYHAHDLMADLVSKKNKYRKFIIPYALPLPGEDRVDLKTHRGRLTFPEMFCWEDFEDIYDDQGASIFATQYELKVLPESDRLVNEEDIRFWKFLPDNRQRLLIVDPAGTEKGKNDPSGFVVMDIDETGKVFIVYAKHFWLKSHAVIEMMQALQRAYRIESEDVYVEREKYSIAMADTIEHFYPTANFSFVDHKNEPTEKRIFRLKQWFDTNRILLGDDQRDLIYETTNYPDIKHEDLLVCVAYGIKVMSPPKKKTAQPFEEAVEPGFAADIAKLQKLQAARQVNYDRYF